MQPNRIKDKRIIKAQEGNIIWDSGKYLIPIVGTYYSIKDAVNDPSWKNVGLAGLSVLGDAASIFGVGELAKAGVGAIKAGKTLKAMKPAIQAVEETNKIASRAANTYNKARQATNAVSLMNDLNSPMSTVVKMAKKEDAARAAFQAATKNADNAYNYWDGLQLLYNKQRVPINKDAVTAGITGFVSTNAAQQAIKDERGGVLKDQHGSKLLNKWQQLYDSKFGSLVRDFMYGKDWDLSEEDYYAKHNQPRPIGSSGMLGFLVAPEWEGLEIPEVTSMHYGLRSAPKSISAVETSRFVNVPRTSKMATESMFSKFLQKPLEEQNNIVKFWNGENFSSFEQLQRNPKEFKTFQNWWNKINKK